MLSQMPQHSISADEISFNAAMQAPFQWKCLTASHYFWNDDKGNIETRRIDIDEYWNLSEEIVRTTVEHIQYCSTELMIYVASWYFIAVDELICALEMSLSGSFSQHHLKYIDRTVDSEVLSINDHQCAKHLELHSLCPLSACRPAVGSLIGNECFWSSCGWQGWCASHFMGGSSLVIFSRFVLITLWSWLFEVFVVVLISWLLIVLQHLWMTLCFFESKLWN